ncbi:arogenate dehydratase/prephenate dehydratase 2, chloroplastic [Alnus glutinosa]|uniref:arogenate dehydratase/prephenate dehydratase 2, chloroplastic n=1 Tax=Alnus glutinosa TaxID=3517 RepID=UPI002D783CEA|nr:arogenate dehydratase/prephenate dehydratase 2, chloroplastic [Alnus glutinosa]XP_062172696.1 arogenate dehydratase/prephenate dehydratase 2, chloroplastic [Alnus glutinosa]XP_062172697.1 arogenate dehydratase/prephenate dehydratase 2, chloroplastic [Alnus glutinosa]
MAASIVRSPTNPLSRHVTSKPSPSEHRSKASVTIHVPYPKRRRYFPVLASLQGDHDNNDNNDRNAQALQLQRILDDSQYDVVSKDPNMLPRPLSSSQFSDTISHGSRLRVAYQGVGGAYSESAAEKAYPNCEAVPCEQFDTAFEAVERWLVDRAVLPIENSLGGSIHRNYDLLLRHSLHIVGEVKFAVRHCLMANHGVKIEELKRVLSHPQALAQCEHTLTRLGLVREAVDDTAGAAKHVAFHKLEDTGAVASSTAAMIYGLNILAQDIQDDCDNVTRFLILAREPIIPGIDRPFKTSIVFSLEEGPGVLFKALAVFALRQINLTKIESRPLRKQLLGASDDKNNGVPKYFDYLFYVDFEASMADQNAQNALRHLKEFATFLRVLGSYPVDTSMI